MVRVLLDLLEEVLDAGNVGRVRGNGDGGARDVGEGVELLDRGVAGGGFAARDEDLGGACLEKPGIGDRNC
jgi:hypothetical protein